MSERNERQFPHARRSGVLVEEVGDETMLFLPESGRYIALNPTAAYVWGRCDGTATVAEIIDAFQARHPLEGSDDLVWLALDMFRQNGLLEQDIALPDGDTDASRQKLSRRAALVAAAGLVALPLVTSLVAPEPAAAQSGGSGGSGGGGGSGGTGDPGGTPDPADCVGAWTAWGPCSTSCGPGVQYREFVVSREAVSGGVPCAHADGTFETRPCDTGVPCPVDCQGEWTPWSECSASCGEGVQTRTFYVTQAATYLGGECAFFDGSIETRPCNTQPCTP